MLKLKLTFPFFQGLSLKKKLYSFSKTWSSLSPIEEKKNIHTGSGLTSLNQIVLNDILIYCDMCVYDMYNDIALFMYVQWTWFKKY